MNLTTFTFHQIFHQMFDQMFHPNNISIHHQLINSPNNPHKSTKIMNIHMIDQIMLIKAMLDHFFMKIKTTSFHLMSHLIEAIIIWKRTCNIKGRKIC